MTMRVQGAAQLHSRLNAIAGTGRQLLEDWQTDTEAGAKRRVHKRTGNLSRTIHQGALTDTHAVVDVSANYAAYVEYGTRPHVIVPRFARVLAWSGPRRQSGSLRSGSGATNFAMRVNHPGSKPYPFLEPAAKTALRGLKLAGTVITKWNEGA